ncbi:TPA: DUF3102 domain-containing protein [Salmonella enterica]|uniref:DUF3102 domain-containing protein n=1 Tax=Salmonella enterica TaxID=28901 RepID=A0A743ZHJ4_SALER|nr:DUF3102 domain-containing protein [Salmonella enterica]HAF5696820.1 DUF3102 domain-containing protein [Salmonella enterica]
MANDKSNDSFGTNQESVLSAVISGVIRSSNAKTTSEDEGLVSLGKKILACKEELQHGEFTNFLHRCRINLPDARKVMRIAHVFGGDTPRAAIAKTGIGKTKLNLLARLDEVTLDLLASGGAYNDHTLDDILRMSARELQRVIQSGEDIICERTLTNNKDIPSLPVEDEPDKEAEIKQSGKNEENKKQYCRELLKVALRYSDETELTAITKFIEHMIACALADKYNPGLNAASYEVYNKFAISRRAAQ